METWALKKRLYVRTGSQVSTEAPDLLELTHFSEQDKCITKDQTSQ